MARESTKSHWDAYWQEHGDPHGRQFTRYAGMTENVIWTCRFFDPPWIKGGQLFHFSDALFYAPHLIGIHHQMTIVSNLLTKNRCTAHIVLLISAYFHFEMGPTFGDCSAAKLTHLLVAVP